MARKNPKQDIPSSFEGKAEMDRIRDADARAAFLASLERPGRRIPALVELLKIPPVLVVSKNDQ